MTDPAAVVPAPPNDKVRDVAVAYRFLLIGVLLSLITNILVRTVSGGAVFPIAVLALGVVAFDIVWTVRLCKALDRSPWLYAIGVVLPIIGLIVLVTLSQAATKYLKSQGVEVGFFGAKV